MPHTLGQDSVADESSPAFYAGTKLSEVEQALLWALLQQDPTCPSRVLLTQVTQRHIAISVSLRQVNWWRALWGLNRAKGRPCRGEALGPVEGEGSVLRVTPQLSFVGVHLFAHWLHQRHAFDPVVAQLEQAVATHHQRRPEDDFALLHHRHSTLLHRFEALFFAPLLGIAHLSEFDTREHPLQTLIGHSYQSSTLNQFLAQLERVGAAETLMRVLVAEHTGEIIYVDGHMIAYCSRRSMHKGKITMLGRIMAGSQAVIAHDATGQAVFVAYHPPDIHLSRVILAYCEQVAQETGSDVFVIDRAVNSVALAQAFDHHELGLLCMLNDHEHAGLTSFEATQIDTLEDGTKVYSGPWKESRPDDPRCFVIVEPPKDKTLVYWGTPKVEAVLEKRAWPQAYRQRNEMQELSFKSMIEHGARDINYGRKTIVGPDRHHQRQQVQLEAALQSAQQRVEKKTEAVRLQHSKVAESESQGHGTRLVQRQNKLVSFEQDLQAVQAKHDELAEQVATLGPAGQRADRDFRKQTIMTLRTLFLENLLRAFMAALLATLPTPVSLQRVLSLLFERRGARMETPTHVVYWVNSAGLCLSNRRLLGEIIEGLGAMGLQDQRGKPIHVRLKEMPP
jgi:hypothetical protein